jgi:hypothetical protein
MREFRLAAAKTDMLLLSRATAAGRRTAGARAKNRVAFARYLDCTLVPAHKVGAVQAEFTVGAFLLDGDVAGIRVPHPNDL